MTLCQDAHPETCRTVEAFPGCTCRLCEQIGVGKFWYCVACDCLPCRLAREIERIQAMHAVEHWHQGRMVLSHDPAVDLFLVDDVLVLAKRDARGVCDVRYVPVLERVVDWDAVASGCAYAP